MSLFYLLLTDSSLVDFAAVDGNAKEHDNHKENANNEGTHLRVEF